MENQNQNQYQNPQDNNAAVQQAVNQALDEQKKKKKKKRLIILAVIVGIIVIIAIAGSAGGGSDSSSGAQTTAGSASEATNSVAAQEKEKTEGKIGDYICTVKSAEKCKNWEGKNSIKITYNFTNNSSEAQSFDVALKQAESNAIWFKATDFRVCCVKILVNPKGLTAFYALPTQKSFCFKLLAPKTVLAWMNFCF